MFNYLGKFIPNLAAKKQDLCALIRKNAEVVWEDTHTKILEALKAEVKDNTTLQYFDPQKGITIDPNGPGCVSPPGRQASQFLI